MTRSGTVIMRTSRKKKNKLEWAAWKKIITRNDSPLDMIHKVDAPPKNRPTLAIKGDVQIEQLKNKKLEDTQEPENLRPLVSNEQGDIFSLPYGRDNTKDHFIIPITRSGWRSFDKDQKSAKISNLFNPEGKYRWGGKHLIEIKLLINHKKKHHGAVIIYYTNDTFHNVHTLGDIKKIEQKGAEWLKFEECSLDLKTVQNKKDKDEKDISIEYSGRNILSIRHFITRYSTN